MKNGPSRRPLGAQVEATIGFEPMNSGFADRRVRPLRHVAGSGVVSPGDVELAAMHRPCKQPGAVPATIARRVLTLQLWKRETRPRRGGRLRLDRCGGRLPKGAPATLHDLSAAAPLIAVASPGWRPGPARRRRARNAPARARGPIPWPGKPQSPDQIAAIRTRLAQTTVKDCLAGFVLEAPEPHQRAVTACHCPS